MRLGARRIFTIQRSRVNTKKVSVVLVIWLILLLVLYSTLYFLKTIRPIMSTVAEARAQNLALQAINEAVNEIFSKSEVSFENFIRFERSVDGEITAVQSNMTGVNQLKATVSMGILEKIANLTETGITIPLGSFMGSDILAGIGPKIHIKLMPVGNLYVNFLSDFSEAGINQTKLEINLEVEANVMLLMPTIRKSSQVVTKLPVIQTVIVGDVPNSYIKIDRDGYDYEGDVLDLAPS